MHLQILIVLVAMAFLGLASSHKPDCERSCGNLSIPFPFGLDEECSYNSKFHVTCNRSLDVPTAYYGSIKGAIKNISLSKGEMEIEALVAHDCYDIYGQAERNEPYLGLSDFWISSKNRFVAIGCDTYAYISGKRGNENIGSGCISTCDSNGSLKNGSCSGVGCCEIKIPEGMSSFNLTVSSYNNHSKILDFNPCSHAFVSNTETFNFSTTNLRDFESVKRMPMLLEWAIGDLKCDMVKPEDYLCKGNSECDPNYVGPGYRCRCLDGYEGNPYDEDCKKIDECNNGNNKCDQLCTDTDGSYHSSCKENLFGDGWDNGTKCTRIGKEKSESHIIEIAAGTSIAGVCLLILVIWLYIYLGLKKRKLLRLREKFFKQNGGLMLQQRISGDGGSQDQAKVFTVEELQKATNNYDESWIIGKGGYGTVYKGILSENRIVAIKKSKLIDKTQSQIEQFINEVVILSQVNHRNVVKLIGCCLETEVPLLVYEFIPNGTLSDHIHDETKAIEITWDIRLKIATETAGALSYLHFAASVPIIHRDVKPMNILLDESYIAKVADFGASRLIPMDQNELATMVQGTLGYLDPEYLHSNQLTEKSDVYSFGVVLVELLTGKMVLDFDRPQKDRNLSKYFLSALKEERLLEVLDEHLQLKEVPHEIIQVSRLAERCLHLKGDERPTMKEVALELEGILASMIDKHTWVKGSSNEEETVYLLKEPMEDYESTDGSDKSSPTFYSMIVKPSGR